MERSPSTEARFDRLFEEYAAAMRLYCLRRLDHHRVDDAVADVFATVWRRMDRIPDGDGALRYLYGIARNVVRNHQRSARRLARLRARSRADAAPITTPGPEAQVIVRQQEREVLDALERLRPADRELLRLRAWEELSRTDLAAVLGISPGAVDMRLNRAMKRMAGALRANGFEYRPRSSMVEEEGTR